MTRLGVRAAALIALTLFTMVSSARGQGLPAGSFAGETEDDRLAKEVEDPTAILTQMKLQDLYTPSNFQTTAQTNTVQIRPVIPVELFSLMPFKQIIRPTFKIETLATSTGGSTITEFTDTELFDLFLSNWPDPRKPDSAGASDQRLYFRPDAFRRPATTPGRRDPQPPPPTEEFPA